MPSMKKYSFYTALFLEDFNATLFDTKIKIKYFICVRIYTKYFTEIYVLKIKVL